MNIVKVKDSKKSKNRTIRLYMSKVKFEDILFTESKKLGVNKKLGVRS
jgi:hypothetical protein